MLRYTAFFSRAQSNPVFIIGYATIKTLSIVSEIIVGDSFGADRMDYLVPVADRKKRRRARSKSGILPVVKKSLYGETPCARKSTLNLTFHSIAKQACKS
jgi:hypothetical protein